MPSPSPSAPAQRHAPDCVCLLLVQGPSPWLLPLDWLWLGWLVASDPSSKPTVGVKKWGGVLCRGEQGRADVFRERV